MDRGEAGNTARILVLEGLVIQLQTLLSRWEFLSIIYQHRASLFALSEDCQRFLMEVEESADLGMKYLHIRGEKPHILSVDPKCYLPSTKEFFPVTVLAFYWRA